MIDHDAAMRIADAYLSGEFLHVEQFAVLARAYKELVRERDALTPEEARSLLGKWHTTSERGFLEIIGGANEKLRRIAARAATTKEADRE